MKEEEPRPPTLLVAARREASRPSPVNDLRVAGEIVNKCVDKQRKHSVRATLFSMHVLRARLALGGVRRTAFSVCDVFFVLDRARTRSKPSRGKAPIAG